VDGEHLNMNNLSIPNVLGRELCEYYCLDLYKSWIIQDIVFTI
jgi:hypothetical protein